MQARQLALYAAVAHPLLTRTMRASYSLIRGGSMAWAVMQQLSQQSSSPAAAAAAAAATSAASRPGVSLAAAVPAVAQQLRRLSFSGPAELDADVAVIGAGVIGLAIARELAQAGHSVLLLEAAGSIGTETSSRNSEVIHAGAPCCHAPRLADAAEGSGRLSQGGGRGWWQAAAQPVCPAARWATRVEVAKTRVGVT